MEEAEEEAAEPGEGEALSPECVPARLTFGGRLWGEASSWLRALP